ncbi:MAG: cyclic pyranopterin monophosphate synthase MoaC [Anaerolineae bacterium]|jgi:cyclic pyranopterin phosphate synthase|nr:cyclic pyranopterin monophosphate synthase MoaC [Anaerolineae bacterium]
MSETLTHLDDQGRASMVDVTAKPDTDRQATAAGAVVMQPETLRLIVAGEIKKGDVFAVARIAGIMAAKNTATLIPLCHPLPLTRISVELTARPETSTIEIVAQVRTTGKTGVEMEALTAVMAAALTIYDMAKAVDRGMRIEQVRLLEKRGGVHGDYVRED